MLSKSRFIEIFGNCNSEKIKWKSECLYKNVTIINGRAYSQQELLDQGKYRVLRVGNFFSNKDWYYSNLELDPDKYCDKGDLLFAWSASFGAKIWNEDKVIYHYHIWKLKVNNNYNKSFLCFLLNEKINSLKSDTHGSTMLHLTKQNMEKIKFIVPPISMQNEFVSFIGHIDKSKFILQQMIEKLELLKKSRFIEMFGNPVTNSKQMPLYKLEDIGSWCSGGTPHRGNPEYFKGDINWFSAGELNSLFLTNSNEKITKEALDNSSAKILDSMSLLIGMYDSAAFKMGILTKPSACNQACACIKPNKNIRSVWLYYILFYMKHVFLSQRNGVRQKNLSLNIIKNFVIPIPPLQEQEKYVSFIIQTDKSKLVLQKALENLVGKV